MIRAVHVDRRELLAILVGGFAGALARAELAVAWPPHPGSWPWATLLVNVVGALILGYVVAALPRWRPLLGIGFCGALTTFSTMQVELLSMLDRGRIALALGYAGAAVAAGLLAAAAGVRLARHADRGEPIA
jgi:fluoride exporter